MANPVLRGFQSLTRFAGRDTRRQFWPYAGVVVALMFVLGGTAMASSIGGAFADMQQFAAEHPEAATVQSSPRHYSIRVDVTHPEAPAPDLRLFVWAWGLTMAVAVMLLAAAVSRRLHDSGRSALWGLAPVPFLLVSITGFPMVMADFMSEEPDIGLFFLLFFNNILYMIALVGLIVALALPGTRGPNRFGPEGAG